MAHSTTICVGNGNGLPNQRIAGDVWPMFWPQDAEGKRCQAGQLSVAADYGRRTLAAAGECHSASCSHLRKHAPMVTHPCTMQWQLTDNFQSSWPKHTNTHTPINHAHLGQHAKMQ